MKLVNKFISIFIIILLVLIFSNKFTYAVNIEVFNTLTKSAEKYYKDEEYKTAIAHIDYALRLRPRDKKARLLKAKILLAIGDKKGCTRIVTSILKWDRKNREATRLYLKANPPVMPKWFKFNHMIAKIHKKWKSSFKRKKVLTPEDYRRMAADAIKANLFVTAERYMKDAIRIEPENVKNRMLLADAFARDGKFLSAAQVFDKIIEMTEKNWKFYYQAGSLYRKSDHLDLAFLRFKEALKLNGEDKELIDEVLSVAKSLHDKEFYSTLLEEKVGTVLTDPKYYRLRATDYIEKQEWQKAVDDLKQASETNNIENSNDAYLIDLLEFLANNGGSFKFVDREFVMDKRMMDDFRRIFRYKGDDLYSMANGRGSKKNLARFFNKLGFKSDAIRILKKLAKEEEDAETYYLMAKIYKSMNRMDDVESALDSSKLADDTYIPTRNWLGEIYLNREEFERANFEFSSVLKLEKNNLKALLGMAELHFELNDKEAMQEYIDRAKKIDPNNEKLNELINKSETRGE